MAALARFQLKELVRSFAIAAPMPITLALYWLFFEFPGDAAYFDSADSFAMIRGGHVDVAIMGGLQVDEAANLANWAVPGQPLSGIGGAMDLASGARRLIITMTHVDGKGRPKIVPECMLPLTAQRAVEMIITDWAVFQFVGGALTLTELMPGATLEQVRAGTSAQFVEALR